jgi:hypothetical protein
MLSGACGLIYEVVWDRYLMDLHRRDNLRPYGGKADASRYEDTTQRMLSHFPLLLHEDPQSGLVVGLGSGFTASSMLAYGIPRIDVLEIHPQVVQGAHHYDDATGNVLDSESVHLYLDDAIHFLRMTEHRYDVIASEPTNPWQAGAGNLFTKEYYALLASHLGEGGIVCQFLPTYEISDEVVAILLRTITGTFPYVELFQVQSNDILMIASFVPIRPDLEKIASRMNATAVLGDLREIDIVHPAAILAMHQTPALELQFFLSPGPINRLDFPRAEFLSPEAFFRYQKSSFRAESDMRFFLRKVPGLWWNIVHPVREANAEELEAVFRMANRSGHRQLVMTLQHARLQMGNTYRKTNEGAALFHRERIPGDACENPESYSLSELTEAYSAEREHYFEAYSAFHRSGLSCASRLLDLLVQKDLTHGGIWQRERGLLESLRGNPKAAVEALALWFMRRVAGPVRDDELDALRVLINSLLLLEEFEAAKVPLSVLCEQGRTTRDFAACRRGLVAVR